MVINYIDESLCSVVYWCFTGQWSSSTGYGSKIPSHYGLLYGGRRYRVYAICFSNVASYYVTIRGDRLYVPDFMFPGRIYED